MKIVISKAEVEAGFKTQYKNLGYCGNLEIVWVDNPAVATEGITNLLDTKLVKSRGYDWSGRWLIDGDEIIIIELDDLNENSFWVVKETDRGTSRVRHKIDRNGYITPLGRKLMNRIDVSFGEKGMPG